MAQFGWPAELGFDEAHETRTRDLGESSCVEQQKNRNGHPESPPGLRMFDYAVLGISDRRLDVGRRESMG